MSYHFRCYYHKDGTTYGPYSAIDLFNLNLPKYTPVTEESMNGKWVPLCDFDFGDLIDREENAVIDHAEALVDEIFRAHANPSPAAPPMNTQQNEQQQPYQQQPSQQPHQQQPYQQQPYQQQPSQQPHQQQPYQQQPYQQQPSQQPQPFQKPFQQPYQQQPYQQQPYQQQPYQQQPYQQQPYQQPMAAQNQPAADDATLAARRAALKAKLLAGDKISLNPGGNVVQEGYNDSSINIPRGKLATDDAALRARREELKRQLMSGDKITLKGDGNVTGTSNTQDSTISIPKGKLAALWYETNPLLLEAEKAAMSKCFPGFELNRLDDGRLYWFGELAPGVYETKFGRKKSYHVMAVYQNNHPYQQMGSSVFVYLVQPDVDEIIEECGFRPYHLLKDSADQVYLCTTESDYVKTGSTVTTAASVLAWAVKWLLAYELVLTGDLSKEKFNEHHGI